MLSFLFFADGPCHSTSWKYDQGSPIIDNSLINKKTATTINSTHHSSITTKTHDQNQWWSRRDALCRI